MEEKRTRGPAYVYTKAQRQMIRHNEEIMEDNENFGVKELLRGNITEAELESFREEQKMKFRKFKKFLREGGTAVYYADTQQYEIPRSQT